jgi:hypothetical protein
VIIGSPTLGTVTPPVGAGGCAGSVNASNAEGIGLARLLNCLFKLGEWYQLGLWLKVVGGSVRVSVGILNAGGSFTELEGRTFDSSFSDWFEIPWMDELPFAFQIPRDQTVNAGDRIQVRFVAQEAGTEFNYADISVQEGRIQAPNLAAWEHSAIVLDDSNITYLPGDLNVPGVIIGELEHQPILGYEEKFRTTSDWATSGYFPADTTDPRIISRYISGIQMTYTVKGKVPQRHTRDADFDASEWQFGVTVEWWSPTAGTVDWEPKLAIKRCGEDVSAVLPRNTTDIIEATSNTADELECTTWYVDNDWPEYPSPGDTWYLVLERNPQDPFFELPDDVDVVNVYTSWYKKDTTAEWSFAAGYALGGIAVATVSSSELDVTWTDPLNNIDVVRLDIATAANGPWSTVSAGTAVATQIISVAGLSSGTTYYFRARGENTAGTEWGDWDYENGTTF